METKRFNRVLVMDDDYVSGYLTRVILEEMAIADQILVFTHPGKAIHYIQQHCSNQLAATEACPDLILVDIHMPMMDGFEFLDALQVLEQTAVLRKVIIVLTASASPIHMARMQALGVKAYLSKPLTEESLWEALQ